MTVDGATGPGGTATTVMVVEDYAPLRTLCSRLLERHGYLPVAATSADHAIELLASGIAPAVVVTDLNMPGDVTGHDLIDHLHSAHPTAGIVAITGMVASDVTTHERLVVLVKPFTNDDLLSTVAGLLDR